MSYAAIRPHFGVGDKSLRKLPGLYGLRGMGQDAAAAPAYLPAGTQLAYNVSFAVSLLGVLDAPINAAGVAADVARNVSQNSGIAVIGSQASSNPFSANNGITLRLQLMQDYTDAALVKKVMDDAMRGVGGISVMSSNIAVSSAGPGSGYAAGGGVDSAGAPTSWWNEDALGLGMNNSTYVLLGGLIAGGIYAAKQLL